jgi:uncharacterized protein
VSELPIRETAQGISFAVRVSPRSSRDQFQGVHDGALKVALTAPPVDGEANAALIAFIAKACRVPKRAVQILHGETGRNKVLVIEGIDAGTVRALCER